MAHTSIEWWLRRAFGPALIVLFVAAVTIFGARIFNNVTSNVVRTCVLTQVAVISLYLLRAIYRGRMFVVLSFLTATLYIVVQHLLYARTVGIRPDIVAVLTYLPIPAFVVFSETDLPIKRLIDYSLYVTLAYLSCYVLGFQYFSSLAKTAGDLLADDGTRGARLYLAAAWPAFAAFYAVTARSANLPLRAVALALAMTALYLSQSRLFQFVFFIVFIGALLRITDLRLRLPLFAAFAFVTGVMLTSFVVIDWNPFEHLTDESAAYRAMEYRRVVIAVGDYWLFGIGIPSDSAGLSQFLKQPRYHTIFASDLGPMGVLFMLGMVGLIIFVAAVYFAILGSRGNFNNDRIACVQLTCVVLGTVGMISPLLLLEPSAMFFSLLVTVYIRNYRKRADAIRAADAVRRDHLVGRTDQRPETV